MKQLPIPGALSTLRSPPIPRARSRLIASPSPTPSPFSGNYPRKHRLHEVMPCVVPAEFQDLHAKLQTWRNSLFTHTDLNAYAPKAAMWKSEAGAVFPMSFRGHSYADVYALVPRI